MSTSCCICSEPANSELQNTSTRILLHPVVVEYVDFLGLVELRCICKTFKETIDKNPEQIGYWKSICSSFSLYAGVYSLAATTEDVVRNIDYKKHFYQDLWSNRLKWTISTDLDNNTPVAAGEKNNTSYKVQVACRFRPGEASSEKVCLPLHQFLKVKRHQKAQKEQQNKDSNNTNSGSGGMLVGEEDPQEFVDPFLGSLMKDPVLLAPSGKIVERSVALQCVLRGGGRDPFNGKKLTMEMLTPQPELAARIQEWRQKKLNWDVSLELKELKPLVEDSHVNNDLLDALMEVERINNALRRAEQDAIRSSFEEQQVQDQQLQVGPEVDIVDADAAAQLQQVNPIDHAQDQLVEIAQLNPFSLAAAEALAQQQQQEQLSDVMPGKKAEKAGIVSIDSQNSSVSMHVPGSGVRPFHYTNVHTSSAEQHEVYGKSAQDAVASVLNGFNACIMCYGQTGAGKTYTFFGPEGQLDESVFDSLDESALLSGRIQQLLPPSTGLVVRACVELLAAREKLRRNGISVSFTAQFVEIYEEQATDLLTGRTASLRRETGQVSGAQEACLDSVEQVKAALRTGHDRKRFAATAMNDRSSRSHTAFIVQVLQKIDVDKVIKAYPALTDSSSGSGIAASTQDLVPSSSSSSSSPSPAAQISDQTNPTTTTKSTVSQQLLDPRNSDKLLRSQLHLVDLAGSERVKRSGATGERMREAVGINSSLLVLGKVIAALVKGHRHVPYLESKLTTMLRAAFGGNSRTTVVVNCRSDGDHGDETLQSMRFGERCAMISNSMRQTAASFESTLATINQALQAVHRQLATLEARGKQHLSSYKNLEHSCRELTRKQQELIVLMGAQGRASPMAGSKTKEDGAADLSFKTAAPDASTVLSTGSTDMTATINGLE